MSDVPFVSVIIPAYKAKDCLRLCLHSLDRNLKTPHEIIVVEDCGHDGTQEMVRNEFPAVKLVVNSLNLGCAPSRNEGIKHSRGDLILLIDSDIEMLPGAFESLWGEMEVNPSIGFITCNKRSPDGHFQRSMFEDYSFATTLAGLVPFMRRRKVIASVSRHNKACDPGWISIGHSLVRRVAWNVSGGCSNNFFFYGEEVDFAMKLRMSGWKLRFVPHMGFVHHGSVSQLTEVDRFRVKAWLSMVMLADLYWPRWQAIVLRIMLFFRGLLVCALQSWRGQNPIQILRSLPRLLWPIPLTTNLLSKDALP